MSQTALILLFADAATSWSLQNILLTLLGFLGGSTVLATVSLLTLRGYWTKYVSPLILEEVSKWHADQAQVSGRAKEHAEACRAWHTDATQVADRTKEHADACKTWTSTDEQKQARKEELVRLLQEPALKDTRSGEVKGIIDNEIMRTDGLIHREIKTQVGEMETKLTAKLDTVLDFLRKDIEFKEQMLERMGALEGAVNASRPKPGAVPRTQTPPLEAPKIPR